MSVVAKGVYLGHKKTKLIHAGSGAELLTDAPRDNAGEGSAFSPTDLVAGALGACMLTMMGIYADRHGLDLAGATMEVDKEMEGSPRRIGCLFVVLHLPASIPPEQRGPLERIAATCPVYHSLSAELSTDSRFVYDV